MLSCVRSRSVPPGVSVSALSVQCEGESHVALSRRIPLSHFHDETGKGDSMEGKKALFLFLFMILVVEIFWHGALRTLAIRNPDKPWARGLLFAL